jgi:aryl-alcohol dehydrogenase-like predicted oxidoreductase
MEYREIGSTGLKASRIGLGGFAFAICRQKEVERSVDRAFELGINYFDSARLYGTEGKIGKALKTGRFDLAYGRYNPTTRQNEDSVIPLAAKLKKGFITISALAWGIYSVPVEHHPFFVGGRRMPAAVASFRYVLSNPDVHVVLAGVRSPEELDELVETEALPPLTEEEKAQIIYHSERLGRGAPSAEYVKNGVRSICPS